MMRPNAPQHPSLHTARKGCEDGMTRRASAPLGGRRPTRTAVARAAIYVAVALSVFGVAPAYATPINPPSGATFTLDCNGQSVLVTVPSFLAFTPRMSVDGTTRFIPVSLTLTITDLTTNEALDSETLASRAPGAARLATATCVDISTDIDPDSGHVIETNFTSRDIETPVR
jgi:hypothetical protein